MPTSTPRCHSRCPRRGTPFPHAFHCLSTTCTKQLRRHAKSHQRWDHRPAGSPSKCNTHCICQDYWRWVSSCKASRTLQSRKSVHQNWASHWHGRGLMFGVSVFLAVGMFETWKTSTPARPGGSSLQPRRRHDMSRWTWPNDPWPQTSKNFSIMQYCICLKCIDLSKIFDHTESVLQLFMIFLELFSRTKLLWLPAKLASSQCASHADSWAAVWWMFRGTLKGSLRSSFWSPLATRYKMSRLPQA